MSKLDLLVFGTVKRKITSLLCFLSSDFCGINLGLLILVLILGIVATYMNNTKHEKLNSILIKFNERHPKFALLSMIIGLISMIFIVL